jgi:hypothetical protein
MQRFKVNRSCGPTLVNRARNVLLQHSHSPLRYGDLGRNAVPVAQERERLGPERLGQYVRQLVLGVDVLDRDRSAFHVLSDKVVADTCFVRA